MLGRVGLMDFADRAALRLLPRLVIPNHAAASRRRTRRGEGSRIAVHLNN
jgi:hypothetical protein